MQEQTIFMWLVMHKGSTKVQKYKLREQISNQITLTSGESQENTYFIGVTDTKCHME